MYVCLILLYCIVYFYPSYKEEGLWSVKLLLLYQSITYNILHHAMYTLLDTIEQFIGCTN